MCWSIFIHLQLWTDFSSSSSVDWSKTSLCSVSSSSRSRASTTPRSTWAERAMRPYPLPRRRWCWGYLCAMLRCRCLWIRRSTRTGQPIRGLRLLTYTKEGKRPVQCVLISLTTLQLHEEAAVGVTHLRYDAFKNSLHNEICSVHQRPLPWSFRRISFTNVSADEPADTLWCEALIIINWISALWLWAC